MQWEKVLYKKTNFPDDHTDEKQFLSELRKNVNVVRYRLSEAVCGGCVVMSQVNIIAIYVSLFELVQMQQLSSRTLLMIVAAAASFCFAAYLRNDKAVFSTSLLTEHGRTLLTLVLFGYGFTPVVRTLTTSISTDTIYATSMLLFTLCLVFHDYGMPAPVVSSAFSVNLCLAASVCLISRVESDSTAFHLFALSLCAFCFWPPLRNWTTARRRRFPVVLVLLMGPTSVWLLSRVSLHLAGMHTLLHFGIVAFCPWLLVRMQFMKSTIHGPWDEASLKASMKRRQ